jgi:hypothetical protein
MHVCADPKSPFMPEPSAPTIRATTNAMRANKSAYCTVDTPCSEWDRFSAVPNAPSTAKSARMSRSVTIPSPALLDRFLVGYLAFRAEPLTRGPHFFRDRSDELHSRECESLRLDSTNDPSHGVPRTNTRRLSRAPPLPPRTDELPPGTLPTYSAEKTWPERCNLSATSWQSNRYFPAMFDTGRGVKGGRLWAGSSPASLCGRRDRGWCQRRPRDPMADGADGAIDHIHVGVRDALSEGRLS